MHVVPLLTHVLTAVPLTGPVNVECFRLDVPRSITVLVVWTVWTPQHFSWWSGVWRISHLVMAMVIWRVTLWLIFDRLQNTMHQRTTTTCVQRPLSLNFYSWRDYLKWFQYYKIPKCNWGSYFTTNNMNENLVLLKETQIGRLLKLNRERADLHSYQCLLSSRSQFTIICNNRSDKT